MELFQILSIGADAIVLIVVGSLIRYQFAKLRQMEDKVSSVMSEREVRDYVETKIAEKLELIRYILDEIKTDISEIKTTHRRHLSSADESD